MNMIKVFKVGTRNDDKRFVKPNLKYATKNLMMCNKDPFHLKFTVFNLF